MTAAQRSLAEQMRGLQRQIREAEAGIEVHQSGPRGSKKEALNAAIKTVDLLMKARELASSPVEKKQLTIKLKAIISRAEDIKKRMVMEAEEGMAAMTLVNPRSPTVTVPQSQSASKSSKPALKAPTSTRPLTTREKTIILKSSKLCGHTFPPWESEPQCFEFESPTLFSDPNGMLGLSESQANVLDSWKRPAEIHERPTMTAENPIDLVQDALTDCSIVASMCAAVSRNEKGHQLIGGAIIYPQNSEGEPIISPNGKYVIKLYFNGCYRRVVIDDYVPVTTNDRALHVICRANPPLLWPALVEKAYLKVMGGYDFPGSNSGTDLLALTGWVPEHVFLQSDDIDPASLWKRIYKAWGFGDVLITLGTGSMTEHEEDELGLVSEHDYAVLDLKEIDGRRLVLVKNPWSEGKIWKGGLGHLDSDSEDEGEDDDREPEEYEEWDESTMAVPPVGPGQFWIDLDHVCRHFANIYLNWNPALFSFRYDHHFTWDTTDRVRSKSNFSNHPQFRVENPSETRSATVWLLLQRHIQGQAVAIGGPQAGYISLYVFEKGGERVYLSDGAIIRGPYVDSPQTLLRLDDLPPKTTYTIVVSCHDLSQEQHSFTLSTFSDYPLKLATVVDPFPFQQTIRHAWLPHTAGGNAHSPAYPKNPQFKLTLGTNPSQTTAKVILLLEGPDDLSVHVKLVWGGGKRIAIVTTKNIIAESGEYRRGCAMVEVREVPCPGVYTVVASTFEVGQVGEFLLRAWGEVEIRLEVIQGEEAGKLTKTISGHWPPPPYTDYEDYQYTGSYTPTTTTTVIAFPISTPRLTRISFVARSTSKSSASITATRRSPLRISFLRRLSHEYIISAQQRHQYLPFTHTIEVLATSGPGFSDAPQGVRTGEIDVEGNGEGWTDGASYVSGGYYGVCGSVRGMWEYCLLLERMAGGGEWDNRFAGGEDGGGYAQRGIEEYEVVVLADGAVEVGDGRVGGEGWEI